MVGDVFDPLNRSSLAESIARALVERPTLPLPLEDRFEGPGIYALYYVGDLPVYAALTTRPEFDWPIYVGKAESKASSRMPLYSRINDHVRSVSQAEDLSPEDFKCRYLLIDDAWIRFSEILMIEKYKPLWNSGVLAGIGGHAPGSGRGGQQQSPWDTLHPGRRHAAGRPPNPKSIPEIESEVREYFDNTVI